MNLLDSLFGAFLLMMIVAVLALLMHNVTRGNEADAASWQLGVVAGAAEQYVNANRAELLADADFTKTEGKTLNADDLKNAGCLQPGFPENNVWGQPFRVFLRRRSDDPSSPLYQSIQTITAAVGIPEAGGWSENEDARISFVNDRTMEAALRTKGCGYVPGERLRTLYGIGEHSLYGPKTQWSLDLDSEYGIDELEEGSFAIVSSFAGADASGGTGYLYRAAVDGSPELNRMETALDMNGHSIGGMSALQLTPIGENKFYYNGVLRNADNVAELCQEDGTEGLMFLDSERGVYVCRDARLAAVQDSLNSVQLKSMNVVENGALVDKPSCPQGSDPHVYAVAVSTAEGLNPTPIQGFQTWAEDASETQWKVMHRLHTVANPYGTDPDNAMVRILAMTTCLDPNMNY